MHSSYLSSSDRTLQFCFLLLLLHDWRYTKRLGRGTTGRQAAKEVLPDRAADSCIREHTPVKGTEIEKSDTQNNRDYVSVEGKMEF